MSKMTKTKKALKVARVWKNGELFAAVVCDGLMPAGERSTALMLDDEPVALVHDTDLVVLEEPSAEDVGPDADVFGSERLAAPIPGVKIDASLAKANRLLFSKGCGGDCKCGSKEKARRAPVKKAQGRKPAARKTEGPEWPTMI